LIIWKESALKVLLKEYKIKEINGRKRKGHPHKTWNDVVKRIYVENEIFFE